MMNKLRQTASTIIRELLDQIRAFTVLKNGSILNNILLLRKRSAVDPNQESDDKISVVRRHPHRHITLEHPRYHLRFHSNPPLSLVALSSVHGTWVKNGGSSRVPMSQGYNVDEPHQEDKHEAYTSDDDLECSDLSLSSNKTFEPLTSSVLNYSTSDDEVEHSCPLRSGNKNESENLQKISNGSAPVFLIDSVNRDVRPDVEQMNRAEMMDESSASMVLYDGVDVGVKFESDDQEIMKKESAFVFLPDITDMDQQKVLTPDISKAKETHMNLQSVHNGSASMKLFDGLDEKEVEFYTPDKENKNPNAFSGKSFSKKAVNSTVKGEKDIFGLSQKLISTDEGVNGEHEVDPFVNCEVVLDASSEEENKSREMKMECNFIHYPQTVQKAVNSSQGILCEAADEFHVS